MMKGLKLFILITAIILFSFPGFSSTAFGISVTPISPSGKKITGDQWLFVIGINTYIEWPRLDTAVNDARSVKETLLSRYHFDNEHLIELYDEEATRSNIIRKFRFLAQNLKEEDSLFLFYAGHGYLDPITKSGSWIPVESGTKDVSAWISNNYIKGYLSSNAIKAKHILLVSDSCFSGDFFRGHRGKLPEVTDEVIRRSYELTSRQAITSGGLEPVTDSGFGNNSVFTHFLVKALENNQSPFLIPSEFFIGIKAGVAENAEQFPQFGSLTNTGGQQGGEFVFFLKQGVRLENLSQIENHKQKEYEHLKKMQIQADIAKRKETREIALKEKQLADLDRKIEAMNKRLGTSEVRTDDSLDAMLAMVRQKEKQARNLEKLRQQKEEEQRKREIEIAQLKKEREANLIAALEPEVKKYKEIVSSEYGKSLKSSAWQALLAKCPKGWAKGLKEGNIVGILLSPIRRQEIAQKKEMELIKKRENERVKKERLTMGLVAYYPLDEGSGNKVFDKSKYGNHGFIKGGPRWVVGKINNALHFDGQNDYIEIQTSQSLKITGALTICAWIKLSPNWYPRQYCNIAGINLHGGQSYDSYYLNVGYWSRKHDRISLGIIGKGRKETVLQGKRPISQSEWIFVAGVFVPGQYMRVYIDGILENEKAIIPNKIQVVSTPFTIGAITTSKKGSKFHFKGTIDEVAVFSIALNLNEINMVQKNSL